MIYALFTVIYLVLLKKRLFIDQKETIIQNILLNTLLGFIVDCSIKDAVNL